MTQRFSLERVPNFTPKERGDSSQRQLQDAVTVTQRNFQKIERLLLRAIQDGGLVADGTITLDMLTAAAKALAGDVTGTIGSTGATVVERIRGGAVAAPTAGEDTEVLSWDQGSGQWLYVGPLLISQNLADLASASTARTNLGLGAMAVQADDPNDAQEYVRKSNAWSVASVPAGVSPPDDFDLLTDGVGELVFAGGDVTWIT